MEANKRLLLVGNRILNAEKKAIEEVDVNSFQRIIHKVRNG
jgi:hypothetical protein